MRNEQHGVVSYRQALDEGLSPSAIEFNLKAGRWQRLYHGVYLSHNGPVSRMGRIWAVLVAAGRGATATHTTAAELVGLTDAIAPTVHVTIPANRRIGALDGARIHHSQRIDAARHPTRRPPQTRVEETVLDLAEDARSITDAVGWLTAACGRRLTRPDRVAAALAARKKIRWRRELLDALSDVDEGNQSVLELRYFRTVERAHGLPVGVRQAPHLRSGGQIYDDVWYPAFQTVIELDGRVAHPIEGRIRDLRRDNVASIRGDAVLHYGWADVAATPCATALQVATVLKSRGWPGSPHPCSPLCVIRKDLPVIAGTILPDHGEHPS